MPPIAEGIKLHYTGHNDNNILNIRMFSCQGRSSMTPIIMHQATYYNVFCDTKIF